VNDKKSLAKAILVNDTFYGLMWLEKWGENTMSDITIQTYSLTKDNGSHFVSSNEFGFA
jgi:hypothetical protein